MTDSLSFTAELLRRSAAGYAGVAASALLEHETGLRQQGGALLAWKTHLNQRCFELAAALAAGEPRLFSERVRWSRKTFLARGQDERLLATSLGCLRAVLLDTLPPDSAAPAGDYLATALRELDDPPPALDPSELDPAAPAGKLALTYLQDVLEGNTPQAVASVVNAVEQGMQVETAYLDVLLGAQKEIGRLWHANEATVAEEHLVSATTQRTMAILAHASPRAPDNGKTAVFACATGNAHDIATRALADLFYLAGWRSIFLGADVPVRDLPATLDAFNADLLALSGTLTTQIESAGAAVRAIREHTERPLQIIVGGAAFDEAPDTAARLGADGYAASLKDALAFGQKLAG